MKKILAGLVLAGGSLFAGPAISVGVGLGVPVVPAPAYVAPAPVYAAPGWVNGYWYFSGGHRLWHAGYWRPGFRGGFVRGFRR